MSVAAQAVRPKTAAPAPEIRRRQRPPHGAMLSGSPRYLRANIRLGGLQDREEHEADHAASTITAGGCHQVHDPGGAHNLRAAGPAAATTRPAPTTAGGVEPSAETGVRRVSAHEASNPGGGAHLRASSAHAVVDPGAEGRIRRVPGPEPDKSDGSGDLRASSAHVVVDPDAEGRVRRASGHESGVGPVRAMPAAGQREPEKQVRVSSPPANDPAASGHVHAKPAHEASDPGGAQSLRAMPARVVDPGASGRIRRTTEHEPARVTPTETSRAKPDPLHHAASVVHDARHAGDADADAEAAQWIETARLSGGHPLPPAVRTRLEHGFGETMEGVRVDTSHAGRSAAAAIGARAYTEGERITLGHGESEHDLKLMAHEATHVVQNRRLGPRGTALVERTEIRRREIRPADDADDDRTYRMRDGRVIELPDDMTRADAAKLEADGEVAKRHLGQGPPPQPVPDVHKPADRSKAKKPPPKLAPKHAPGHGGHAGGPWSVGAIAKLKPTGGPVGQYLFAKAGPVLARGIGKLGVLSHHQQTHNDAGKKVQQAEKAVVIPSSEGQSKSNSSQVGTVSGRPAPVVEKNKGQTQLQQSLAENVPRTIEDVDNFKRDQKAQHVGAEVLKVVQTDKNAVVSTFADMEHTPPPQPPEHEPVALPPVEAAPPTAQMNLGQGAVPTLLPEHTDVSDYTKEADSRLKEEGITQEQLDMVDSGDLAAANKEKKGLEKAAQTEPRAIRQFAGDETARVDRELQHEEKTERGALAGHHRQGLGRTAEQQKHAKSALEKKRDEVAAKINGIYQTAQTSVKKKLDDLDAKAMKRFDDGNARASKAFEDNVNRELDAYKDDRYSGWFGWARKAKDWLLGMDDLPKVKAIFENNRRDFVDTLNRLVAEISADNKRVIQECKDELAKARTDIKEYVDKLSPELKDIAKKTAGEVSSKLDELDGFIRKKEEDLQKKLADKQQKAIQAIDDKIAKMKEAMSGALAKLGQLLLWAAKKFFKWTLEQFGYSWSDIEAIIDRGVAILKAIVTKPIQFVKNLIAAAKQGFLSFGKNFLTHLKDALFDWLTGSLEGLQLPETWDLKGIAGVALQMLGITWANIRGKLVKRIGETPVKAMEAGFDLVVTLVRDGPMAAWEKLQDMGAAIKEAFVAAVKDFIVTKIITEAIKTIIAIFVPGAGIVKAVIAIYETIVFFIQKAKQILEMVGNFLSAIGEIASGNIQIGADALEKGLATALKLVINFLARFLHLDAITAKIRNAIQKIRDKVDNALERVVDWIVSLAKKFVGAVKSGVAAVLNWWQEKRKFTAADGTAHSLHFEGSGTGARLIVESDPIEISIFLNKLISDPASSDTVKAQAKKALAFYETNIHPVQQGGQREDLIEQFGDNLTKLSQMLSEIVGASYGDIPKEARWELHAPASATVDELSTRTSGGGFEPTQNPSGWTQLQESGLTKLRGDWKQMHMITAGVGGPGTKNNLIPAPTSVNSGSNVRGFELRVEELVKRKNSRTQKPNVIWITVKTTGFYPADPDGPYPYDGNSYVTGVVLQAGLYFPDQSKRWVKDTRAEVTASDLIPPPNFIGGPIDINTVRRIYITKVTKVSDRFAMEMLEVRGGQPFTSFTSFEARMRNSRQSQNKPITDEFNTSIALIAAAETKNKIRFG